MCLPMAKGCLTSLNNYDVVLLTILVLFIKAVPSQTLCPIVVLMSTVSCFVCMFIHSLKHCWRSHPLTALLCGRFGPRHY